MKVALFSTCGSCHPRTKGGTSCRRGASQGLEEMGPSVPCSRPGLQSPRGLRYHFETTSGPLSVRGDATARSRGVSGRHIRDTTSCTERRCRVACQVGVRARRVDNAPRAGRQAVNNTVPSPKSHWRPSGAQSSWFQELPVRRIIHHGFDPELYPQWRATAITSFLGRRRERRRLASRVEARSVAAGDAYRAPTRSRNATNSTRSSRRDSPRRAVTFAASCHEPKVALLRGALRSLPIQWESLWPVMIESHAGPARQ